ncbi:MAG: Mov34/MPN/PAD-1 family protein [Pseudomonadota bacterium]
MRAGHVCAQPEYPAPADHFELDPEDRLKAGQAACDAGFEQLVGIWHSHPDHQARPSSTDRALAWEG